MTEMEGRAWAFVLVLLVLVAKVSARHLLRRSLPLAPARRVLGSGEDSLGAKERGAVCLLLDARQAAVCSCAPLGGQWAVSAAHCARPRVAFVRPSGGGPLSVDALFRHPQYQVLIADEGRGPDVTALHHDVALVRTKGLLAPEVGLAPLTLMAEWNANNHMGEEVTVLGYGGTGGSAGASEAHLSWGHLSLRACECGGWRHVVCGSVSQEQQPTAVCAGDSGGPLLWRGHVVAVTSMGPVQCGQANDTQDGPLTSVFTLLQPYVGLLEATIRQRSNQTQMVQVSKEDERHQPLTAAQGHAMENPFVVILNVIAFVTTRL